MSWFPRGISKELHFFTPSSLFFKIFHAFGFNISRKYIASKYRVYLSKFQFPTEPVTGIRDEITFDEVIAYTSSNEYDEQIRENLENCSRCSEMSRFGTDRWNASEKWAVNRGTGRWSTPTRRGVLNLWKARRCRPVRRLDNPNPFLIRVSDRSRRATDHHSVYLTWLLLRYSSSKYRAKRENEGSRATSHPIPPPIPLLDEIDESSNKRAHRGVVDPAIC